MIKYTIYYFSCFIFLTFSNNCIIKCHAKENFIIAIDIGHSKNKSGAVSARGTEEYHFNRSIAIMLLEELFQDGFDKTFIINEKGIDISLIERTYIAKKKKADLFISIHHDSVQPDYLSFWIYKEKKLYFCDLFHGYSIFYSEQNIQSKKSLFFAHLLGTALRNNSFIPSLHHAEPIKGENRKLIDPEKGIYRFDDLIVLKNTKMPAILLECGIILNRNEEILLTQQSYKRRIVLSIRQAIKKYIDQQ